MHIVLLLGKFGPYVDSAISSCHCRNAKRMPTDVMEALKAVVMAQGKLSQSVSDKLLKDMENHKQLQLEVWS